MIGVIHRPSANLIAELETWDEAIEFVREQFDPTDAVSLVVREYEGQARVLRGTALVAKAWADAASALREGDMWLSRSTTTSRPGEHAPNFEWEVQLNPRDPHAVRADVVVEPEPGVLLILEAKSFVTVPARAIATATSDENVAVGTASATTPDREMQSVGGAPVAWN